MPNLTKTIRTTTYFTKGYNRGRNTNSPKAIAQQYLKDLIFPDLDQDEFASTHHLIKYSTYH